MALDGAAALTLDGKQLVLDGATAVLGIIGDPVAQVKACLPLTTLLQQQGLNAVLVPFHVKAAHVPQLLAAWEQVPNVAGLIVTVPHKQLAFGLPMARTRAASEAQAVNLIRRALPGTGHVWEGDLGDGAGFLAGLRLHGFEVKGRSVAIAGAGGAGNAIAFALAAAGAARIDVHDVDGIRRDGIVARLRALGYEAGAWDGAHTHADLLVNATPIGMKAGDPLPVDAGAVRAGMTVADVIMKPRVTPLLALAQARGASVVHGRHMMEQQFGHMAAFFGESIRRVPGA